MISKNLKKTLIILCFALFSILIVICAFFAYVIIYNIDINTAPKPTSDVPIEYKIKELSYNEALDVTELKASFVFDRINILSFKAVVQYEIKGTFAYKKGWRPYIRAVHISERWKTLPKNFEQKIGDIVLTPIVSVSEDKTYEGERLDFTVKIQDYLYSGGWGETLYIVRSQDKKSEITLNQIK